MLFNTNNGADFIVVGLGNPGSAYDNTRHNIGFSAVDYIAEKTGAKITKAKFSALLGTWEYEGKKVMLLKPQTFMNLSGDAVGPRAKFYKIPPENVIIIYDDVSLPVGKMRIRRKGSRGGHNVGEKPHPDYDLAAWVLGKFGTDDKKALQEEYEKVFDAVKLIIDGKTDKAMNLYN